MKLKRLLTEQKNEEKFKQEYFNSELLPVVQGEKSYVWRGSKNTKPNSVEIIIPRKHRRPRNSSLFIQDFFDKYSLENGIDAPLRSSSVFCTKDKKLAMDYGKISLVFFPKVKSDIYDMGVDDTYEFINDADTGLVQFTHNAKLVIDYLTHKEFFEFNNLDNFDDKAKRFFEIMIKHGGDLIRKYNYDDLEFIVQYGKDIWKRLERLEFGPYQSIEFDYISEDMKISFMHMENVDKYFDRLIHVDWMASVDNYHEIVVECPYYYMVNEDWFSKVIGD